MIARTPSDTEQQVLAYNGKLTQGEVAELLNLSLPTIRAICRRNGIAWTWQRADQFGENNHNFQGGLARSTIERLTRRIVKASGRCLHTCERCNNFNKYTEQARHHKDRDRSNNTPENLEVLCQPCHVTEHNQDRIRNDKGQYVS